VCVRVHARETVLRTCGLSCTHARTLFVSDLCAGSRFITGGTNSGIMKFVGEARAQYNPTAPLIGISALGGVAGGPQLRRMARGKCFEDEDAGKSFQWDPREEVWKSKAKRLSVTGSESRVTNGPEQDIHTEELTYVDLVHMGRMAYKDESTNELDCNHSHFLLVDNNVHGHKKLDGHPAFGCERELRAHFETCVAGSQEEAYPAYELCGFEQEKQSLNGKHVLGATVLGAISALQAIKIWDKGVGVNGDVILDYHPADLPIRTASGSKWLNVGTAKPINGRELDAPKLAAALKHKTEFTQEEFDAFAKELRPTGLTWEEIGSEKPQAGTEIKNRALAAALEQTITKEGQTEVDAIEGQRDVARRRKKGHRALLRCHTFTREEFDKLVPGCLTNSSYIHVGDSYFKPAVEELNEDDFVKSGGSYFKPDEKKWFAAPIPVGTPILNDKEWKCNEYWSDIASGLKWKMVGVSKPNGRDLINFELAKALTPNQTKPSGLLWVRVGARPTWPLGLKWKQVGSEKPALGTEINDGALAAAMQQNMVFSEEEWESFKVDKLTSDSYIKVGDVYCKPSSAPRYVVNAELEMALTSQTRFTQEEWDRFGIADLRKDDCIESGGAYFLPRLEHKLEFSQDEWDAFGIKDLRITDFIKSGAFYFQPADVKVCSALQAIWLHAGNGPADERLKAPGIRERATGLNNRIMEERQSKKLEKILGISGLKPEVLEEISKRQALASSTAAKAARVERAKTSGLKTGIVSPVRGRSGCHFSGWKPLAKEESLKLFIKSMKDTTDKTSALEILDVHALTMPLEFSYVMSEGANTETVKEAIDKWFKCAMLTDAGDKGREKFNKQKKQVAKDLKISESLATSLFAQRLDSWRRKEREIVVTVRKDEAGSKVRLLGPHPHCGKEGTLARAYEADTYIDSRSKRWVILDDCKEERLLVKVENIQFLDTMTISCKVQNLRRLSASQVQARLLAEMGGYTWKQSSRNYKDDEDDDAGQTGKHNNGSEPPLVPLVSITVQGGPGSVETVRHAARAGTPCLLVRGSGKAADMISDAVLLRYAQIHPAYLKHRNPVQRQFWDFLRLCGVEESDHNGSGIHDCKTAMIRIKQEISFLEATADPENADVKFAALRMADYHEGMAKKPILQQSHLLRERAKELVSAGHDVGYDVINFDHNSDLNKEFLKCLRILLQALEAASTDKCWVFDLRSTEPGGDDFSGALLKCLLNGVARPGDETKDTLFTKLRYTMLWSRDDLMTYLLERMSAKIKDEQRHEIFEKAILFALQNNKGRDGNGFMFDEGFSYSE
jgi:hypothetical protein